MKLNEFMSRESAAPAAFPERSPSLRGAGRGPIPVGQRNPTLFRDGVALVVRYGDTPEARGRFLDRALDCMEPLPESELEGIWRSALRYGGRVASLPGYVPPGEYGGKTAPRARRAPVGRNACPEEDAYGDPCAEAEPDEPFDLPEPPEEPASPSAPSGTPPGRRGAPAAEGLTFRPADLSDVGQARAFAAFARDSVRYSPATGYLVYDGVKWVESDSWAQSRLHEFTGLQLEEANRVLARAKARYVTSGAKNVVDTWGSMRAAAAFTDEQRAANEAFRAAEAYRRFVMTRRDSRFLTATLREARPMVEVDPSALDADGFLLNTPDGTFDLRLGMAGMREHRAEDRITKCAGVSPGDRGRELWERALDTFFCGDAELIAYVKRIAGLAAIGRVFAESMIVAHGDGRNGKSTFWNVLAKALGSYAGSIAADALTAGCRRNVKPELAEAKGRRLLIAAELEEGTRLSTSMIKQLCSTDEIRAEKKYRDPFSFTPTHTLVLYTNHLPKVGANDPGTWRRLILIPFRARIEGGGEVKNYAEQLFNEAGPAVLAWMIEGAKETIDLGYRIPKPSCVTEATDNWRENSDWLDQFLTERCETGKGCREASGAFYRAYRAWCDETGEYTRSTTDFYAALALRGITRKRTNKENLVYGVRLRMDKVSIDPAAIFAG